MVDKDIQNSIEGRTLLITGGTGSFGSTVTRRLLELKPKKIIIFSRDEKKQFDMRNEFNNTLLKFYIGDVRNRDSIDFVMKEKVDYIFHAAALKQVPSCEFFPMEAVQTNVLGPNNVIQSAIAHGVKRMVVLSTDKAVYPINAMGMTKALMEKNMIANAKSVNNGVTTLCGTRYGNVLYSRGSVIPFFINQIKHGKQLTVTHKSMTRFLLPLSDAVDLVLFGLTHGGNGHIYVKKAPAATIETLAQALCEIFHHDKGYKEVGIRNGEKMHETLIGSEEMMRAIDLGDYYDIPPEDQDLDYNQYYNSGSKNDPNKIKAYTSENADRLDLKSTIKLVLSLPEVQAELKEAKKHG